MRHAFRNSPSPILIAPFFLLFCTRGATVSGVIKVCSLRRESPGSRQNRGRRERERESKCLSGKEGEGGERSRGKERGRDMGGEILLYTVCIITLRCTCELFPPRLTRPIHNRVTGVKVLPVIAVAAPRTSPNIVRPPIYHLYPATL